MAGQKPFSNAPELNYFPLFGTPFGNQQQFLNQLLRTPQPNINRESYGPDINRRQGMQFSGDYYNRQPLELNENRERTFREPYNRYKGSQSQEEDNITQENQGRIRGLMDREIPLDFLFPEMGSQKRDERRRSEEFERRNYSTSTRRQSPTRSKPETNDQETSPSENRKYGKRNDEAVPWNALLRRNCYLVPPLDDTYVLALSEKQPGCRTIFIGGLPSLADEDIIREIFNVCGPIEKININSVRSSAQVKHCQLHFVKHDSVERAVKFNGHVLVIGDGRDRKTKIGRIRVDYDKSPKNKEKIEMANRHLQPQNKEKLLSSVYTRKQAFHLLDLIRHDQAITESLEVLAHWFEKGECTRSTVNIFHTMLSTVQSLVKRLIARRKEHELRVEKQKQQAVEGANEIKQQCEGVWKVFEAATKQKSWDHFTKAQRKNITQWHGAIKNEIKSAKEAEIQNRVEVGMDLDDEVPSLGGLIEQPALQMAEGEQNNEQDQDQDQDQPSPSPSKAKKRRVEASESDADSTDALKIENKKLRTQVESLKAIAEQNTSLMWSMQSYQHQAEEVRQQYSNLVAQKEYEIFRLKKALQDANLLGDPQRAMSDLEIVVDLSKDDPNVADMDLETEELTGKHEDSNENIGKEMKDGEQQDDGGVAHEENTANDGDGGVAEGNEHLSGQGDGDTVCAQPNDVSNDQEIFPPSQAGQEVTLEEDDFYSEGAHAKIESTETETLEKLIEEGMDEEKPMEEEGNLEEGEHASKKEMQVEVEAAPVELEKPAEDEGNEAEEQGKESEEDKEGQESNAAEEEEGIGRFVEIDNEQFEVIDDMDEDSEDEYKEVTFPSPTHEQVSEQLATDSVYQPEHSTEKAEDSAVHQNGDQLSELPTDSVYQPEHSADKTEDSAVYQNGDQLSELPMASADYQPNYSAQMAEDSRDNYQEVAMHTAKHEHGDQVSELGPTASADYRHNYNAQYQAWLLNAAASHATMDYGPTQVRISGEELVLVGIICSYLQLCPSGATSGEIRDYLSRQFKERRKDVVERLLYCLPVLFRAEDASGNAKWKFCGFDNFAESKSKS